MRKIDADKLIKTIEKVCFSPEWARFRADFGSNGERDYIINEIVYAPTIEEKTGEWIPVKDRPMTTEERIKFAEHYGIEYCDTADEKVLDCPMPEDGQEILVSTRWGVHTDVADNDIDGEGFISYGLEENGDWEGINAWMPLPKPYNKGE